MVHTIKCAFTTTQSPNCKQTLCTTDFLLNTTRAMISRYSWPVRVKTRMTSQKLCSLFYPKRRTVYKMFALLIIFTELSKQRPPRNLPLATLKHPSTNGNKSSSTFLFIVWSKQENAMASKWGKNINDTGQSPHFDVNCFLSLNSRRTSWNLLLDGTLSGVCYTFKKVMPLFSC